MLLIIDIWADLFGLLSAHPVTPLIIWLLVLIKVDRRAKSKTSTIPLTKEGKYAIRNNLLLNLYLTSCTTDLLSKLTEIPRKYISKKIEYLPYIFCVYVWIRVWLLSLCQSVGQTMWHLIEKVTKTYISLHLLTITHILQ